MLIVFSLINISFLYISIHTLRSYLDFINSVLKTHKYRLSGLLKLYLKFTKVVSQTLNSLKLYLIFTKVIPNSMR